MGGYGSGWQGPKRATVEDSLVLSVSALTQAGALVPGERIGGLWGWRYEGEARPHAIVGYDANLTEPDDPWLRLRYDVSGERADCMVRLVTTRPNYGGRRWWFLCPLVGRRVAKLYLPPGGRLFGSREAYGLTYAFCQASGSPLIASIAADARTSPARVRAILRDLGLFGGRPLIGAPVKFVQADGRNLAGSRPVRLNVLKNIKIASAMAAMR